LRMKTLVLNLVCRAFDHSVCKAFKELVLSKVLPFATAAGLGIEVVETYLPYLEGEEPLELPTLNLIVAGSKTEPEPKGVLESTEGASHDEALEAICL